MAAPTTSILDSFTRADGALGANWALATGTGSPPTISSNAAIGPASGANPVYWTPGAFGPDCEAYMTITTFVAGQVGALYLRMKDIGTTGLDGYRIALQVNGTVTVARVDNNVLTTLTTFATGTRSNGDGLWATIVGSTITVYYKPGAGAWTLAGSVTDATYADAGYIGFTTGNSTSYKVDDFGGGLLPRNVPTLKVEIDFTGNPTAGHADILEGMDNVTSFWRFDSASTLLDAVGTNPGVIEGTPVTTTSPLAYDTDAGLTFNGSSNDAYVLTATNLQSKGNFTACGWVNLPSIPGATRDLIAKRGAWLLQVNSSGKLVATLKDDTSTATVTSNTVLATSTWYHVALVYDGVSIYIYINGVLDNSVAYVQGWESGLQPIRFAKTPSTTSPTWQSTTNATGTASATVTINKPASVASGDLLIAYFHAGSLASAVPAISAIPSGWTELGSIGNTYSSHSHRFGLYYKVATGSEGASYSWTLDRNCTWCGHITRVTGQDTLIPFTQSPYITAVVGAPTTASFPCGAHVPDLDNNLVLGFFSAEGGGATWTESSGTERVETNAGAGTNSTAMCSQTQSSAASLSVTGTSVSAAFGGFAVLLVVGGTGANYLACSVKDWSFEGAARSADDLLQRYESRNSGDGTWTDISADLDAVSIKGCGRQYERGTIEGGTATITLTDPTRKYDPSNTSSAYYPNVLTSRKIRITANLNGTSFSLFKGFVESWAPRWNSPNYAETVVTATDGFKALNRAGVSGDLLAAYSGTQITKLLNKALWPQANRSIDSGSYVMASSNISAGTKAKSEIDSIVDSELGLFFINGAGLATFHDKAHRGSQSRSTSSQATFTDAADYTPYEGSDPSYDDVRTINNWQVTPDSSAVSSAMQEAFDHTSCAVNFTITDTRSTRLASNTDALSQANGLLDETSVPALRIDSIQVLPLDETVFATVLSLLISDRVTVVRTPGTSGSTYSKASFIEGMGSWTINPGPNGGWKVSFPLSPISAGDYYHTIIRDGPVSYWRFDTVA